jgi:hypothetical protein
MIKQFKKSTPIKVKTIHKTIADIESDGISRTFASYTHQMLDNSNIPTKLITIAYNDTKLESYE